MGNTLQGNNRGILLLDSAHYNVIKGNVIQGTLTRGILLTSTSHNLITDNIVYESSHVKDLAYQNIYLGADARFNFVSGNLVRVGDTALRARHGILLLPTATNNIITNNDLRDSGVDASIEVWGTPDNVIYGNVND